MFFLLVSPPFWRYLNSFLGNNWHSRAGLLSHRGRLPALVRWNLKGSALKSHLLPFLAKNKGCSFRLHRYNLQEGEQNVYHDPKIQKIQKYLLTLWRDSILGQSLKQFKMWLFNSLHYESSQFVHCLNLALGCKHFLSKFRTSPAGDRITVKTGQLIQAK